MYNYELTFEFKGKSYSNCLKTEKKYLENQYEGVATLMLEDEIKKRNLDAKCVFDLALLESGNDGVRRSVYVCPKFILNQENSSI